MSALILAIKPIIELMAALFAVIAAVYGAVSALFRRRGLPGSERRRLIQQIRSPGHRVGDIALAGTVGAGAALFIHDHSGHAPTDGGSSDAFASDTASIADSLPDGATALGDLHDLPVADGAAGAGDLIREIFT
jgi:hypothetical protein